MTLIQWIEHYRARRREARIGAAPFAESAYRQRCACLSRLRACTDQDQPRDQVFRFHFRLKEGSWTVTGTRTSIERQLQHEIAGYEAWREKFHAFHRDLYQRYERKRERKERRRRRQLRNRYRLESWGYILESWGHIISTVTIFLLKCLLVLLILAVILALVLVSLVFPPLLFAIPTMLNQTFGRR